MRELAALAGGTLVSEDLTLIAAGLLVHAGHLGFLPALLACFAGIFLGDMALWAAGRIGGRRLLAWPSVRQRAAGWLDRRLGAAVLASRFLPGTRLPLYLAAGALGQPAGRFALWTALGALLWTPVLVSFAALTGRAAGPSPVSLAAAGAGVFVVWKVAGRLASRRARLFRWEFWPAWIIYAPIVPWIAWLSIRHRGFGTIAAANPAIPGGGFVGESKHRILSLLPAGAVLPFAPIEPGRPESRLAALGRIMREKGWTFPLILKPDAGQRGAGVRLVHCPGQAAGYFRAIIGPVLAQVYHPGPREAGVFWYRLPEESRGRIFSITDKVFPEVTGDGRSSLENLIRHHPRYRMQQRVFLARHAARLAWIPGAGERVRLAVAGNHAQGTLFRDGSRLLTPELERAFDDLMAGVEGIHFGRFDVRYADEGAFLRGEDLAIVELNGATSESTDIYDPDNRLTSAWTTLFRQWALLFRIGSANRRRGAAATPLGRLMRDAIEFYRGGTAGAPAD